MVNYIISSQRSLYNLIGQLRATATATSSTSFTLTSLSIDAESSTLAHNNLNEWGPLLAALTLPAASNNIKSLDICNLSPDTAALIVPHIAKLVSRFRSIERFSLRRSPLGAKTAQFVGECLNGHKTLKRIVVEQCDLRSEGSLLFASSLLKLESYKELGNNNQNTTNIIHSNVVPSSSPLELIDLGHNEIRVSACKEIADLVRICVNQSSYFSNLKRIEFRGNNCILKKEELQDQDLLKSMFATRKSKEEMELLKKNISGAMNNNGTCSSEGGGRKIPQLPVGENLKYMTSADQDAGFVFPTLDYLSNQVQQDLSAIPK